MSQKAFYATFTHGRVVLDEPTPQIPEGKRLKLIVADDDLPQVRAVLRIPKNSQAPEFQKLTRQQVHDAMVAYAQENAGITDSDPELQAASLEAIEEKP
jgi:hypothetical protein